MRRDAGSPARQLDPLGEPAPHARVRRGRRRRWSGSEVVLGRLGAAAGATTAASSSSTCATATAWCRSCSSPTRAGVSRARGRAALRVRDPGARARRAALARDGEPEARRPARSRWSRDELRLLNTRDAAALRDRGGGGGRRGDAPALPHPRPAPPAAPARAAAAPRALRSRCARTLAEQRLPRDRDADPREGHARGRARLPGAEPAPAGRASTRCRSRRRS